MRLIPFLLAAAVLSAPARAQEPPAALLSNCVSCHGENGATRGPDTPRLNGQNQAYLVRRLKDLRNPANQTARAMHAMLEPARSFRGDMLDALAHHFSSQAPTASGAAGPAAAGGARLYAQGRGAELPACASCHGAKGEGNDEAPRLAGQHAAYLEDQMESLMLTARVQPGMNKHVWALRREDIKALSAFLAKD